MQDYIPRTVDINEKIDSVTVKQFDNNSRVLHVKFRDTDLTDVDDKSLDLADCTTALYLQPEGGGSPAEVSFVGGTVESAESGIVTFLLPGSVTREPGRYECEIWIYGGDSESHPIISTKPFLLVVEKSIRNNSAIEASQSFSAFDEALITVAALQAEMNSLAASPAGTGGDVGTEVRDIRIGADGREYSSAGAAVRGQIAALKSEIDAVGKAAATSWEGLQTIIREGAAAKVFSVGDQLVCQRGGVDLVWDIIGIDSYTPADPQYTHSMTLQLHDCFPALMQYDAPEALWYTDRVLHAGEQYNFNLGTVNVPDWYHVNIAVEIPAGSQLIWDETAPAVNGVRDSGAMKISLTKGGQIEEGYYANVWHTKLEGNNIEELTVNNIGRIENGNAIYKDSALRQWLNSGAAAGTVWSYQNQFDRPPTWAATADGFLRGMDEDFLAVVGVTAVQSYVNSSWTATLNDRFFLLSEKQVFGSASGEGAAYPYYSGHSDLPSAGTGADSNRVKQRNGSNQGWWLRTRTNGNDYEVKVVAGSDGHITENNAGYASGVAPACNIY